MLLQRSLTLVIVSIFIFLSTHFSHSQTWTQLSTNATITIARQGHSAIYDSANNRMTIFGGLGSLGQLNNVWVLSNANGLGGSPVWTQFSPLGSMPLERELHTAVYDNTNNRMIVFGGIGYSSTFNDVWVLNAANGLSSTPVWTQLSPSGTLPGERWGHTAVHDNTNNKMIIFGGIGSSTAYNDVWVLDTANGVGGVPSWTHLSPIGTPPTVRNNHSAVYDSINNQMIIFGGYNGSYLNDVWVLSNANGLGGTSAWTQLLPTGSSPSTRAVHTAIYDSVNNRMTIFGGFHPGGALNDVWVLSNANGMGGPFFWQQLSPASNFSIARFGHTAVYDSINKRMVVFGGFSWSYSSFLNDTWILTNADYLTAVPKETWQLLDE